MKPIHYWGCGEDHLYNNLPHQKDNTRNVQNVQEDTNMNDVAQTIPQGYDTLEDHKTYH